MASTLWKVYSGKELIAQLRHAEDAALIASVTPGCVVKWATQCYSTVVWRDGQEGFRVKNFDRAATLMRSRQQAYYRAADARWEDRKRKDAEIAAATPRTAYLDTTDDWRPEKEVAHGNG